MGTFRGLNDEMAAITAKPRDQSSRKRHKSVPRAKFSRDTFHAKNVSLGILTNFNAVLNKRGWYRPRRDENRGAAGQIAQNGPENNCAKWHLSNTNSRFFMCTASTIRH